MSKLQSMVLRFPESSSLDAVGYTLYIEPEGVEVTHNSPGYYLVNFVTVDNIVETDLSGIDGISTMDGVYNIGVATIDDAGNESSLSTMDSVPLDFVAPNPPGPLSIG